MTDYHQAVRVAAAVRQHRVFAVAMVHHHDFAVTGRWRAMACRNLKDLAVRRQRKSLVQPRDSDTRAILSDSGAHVARLEFVQPEAHGFAVQLHLNRAIRAIEHELVSLDPLVAGRGSRDNQHRRHECK